MTHPSPDTLRDFVTGALDAAGEEEVRAHLANGCVECQAALQSEAALEHAMWEVRQADAAGVTTTEGGGAEVVELPKRPPVPALAWGGALAAAAVALIVVIGALREPEPAQPPVAAAAPTAPAAVPAAPAPAEAKPAEAEKKEEAAEEKKGAPDEAKEEPKEEAKVSSTAAKAKAKETKAPTKTSARTRRRTATKAEPPPPPPPRPTRRDCDPLLDLDCAEKGGGGGATKASSLSPTDVLAVVKRNLGRINACGEKHKVSATVRAEWRILASGRTSSVRVLTEKYAGTPVGNCVVQEIKRWRFPKNDGKAPPVKFPFKLKGG